LTIPSITPDKLNQSIDNLFSPGNTQRIRLILLVFSLWASLAIGLYLFIIRKR
jgi:hypothetical protein